MIGGDAAFVNANPAVIPIFVSMLFQSLEIAIKHAGIESGLFTMDEARSRTTRSGHGIKEIATLAVERLGGEPFNPIIMAMTVESPSDQSSSFIREMICGERLESTRDAYASRRLGYGELYEGDFALISQIHDWVAAVKHTALSLSSTIKILSQWKRSTSQSKHFAIWFRER